MLNDGQSTKSLNDRVILVTGASRGIGRAVAYAAAKQGATVLLLARSLPHLESLYDLIVKEGYHEPIICPFDLATATPEHYEALAQKINQTFKRLDGLLHNAAQLGSLTPIEHYPIHQWYEIFQVNVHSAFILTQTLFPLLKQSADPSIVFTLADQGYEGKAYWGAYSASKCALRGFMQVLADECDCNSTMRINEVNPKKVATRLRMQAYPGEAKDSLYSIDSLIPHYLNLLGSEKTQPDNTGQYKMDLHL